MEQWSVQQWELLRQQPERLDLLEEGAFIVAQWGEPEEMNVAFVRASLASIADMASQRTTPTATLRERIEVVNAVLFQEYGFQGNTQSYYDARNSFMHRVLSRKTGIPISLSIVWAAVARRLHVPCHLCAQMPCHILVRVCTGEGPTRDLYVDAFHCKIMDYSALRTFAVEVVGSALEESWVAPGQPSQIYERLLRNLLGIYHKESQQCKGENSDICLVLQRSVAVFLQMAAISDSPARVLETRSMFQKDLSAGDLNASMFQNDLSA